MSYGGFDSRYYGCGVAATDPRLVRPYGTPVYGYAPFSRPPPPPQPLDPSMVYPSRAPLFYSSFYVHDPSESVIAQPVVGFQPHHYQPKYQPKTTSPPATNLPPGPAAPVPASEPKRSNSHQGQIILAIFVIILFGNPLFGLAALVLAIVANSFEPTSAARRLGRASFILSITGIIVSIVVVIATIVPIMLQSPPSH